MHIEYGNTRIVFLLSRVVIKVPRVRLGDAFRTLADYFSGKRVGIAGDKFEGRPMVVALAYLFSGITSNRREAAFSKKYLPPNKVIPSCGLRLLGLVHVQRRGREIAENDSRWTMFTSLLRAKGIDNPDLYNRNNFSEYQGALCIHDCGWRLSVKMLDDFALKLLDKANERRRETVSMATSA